MQRREFLKAAAVTALAARTSQAADSRVEILVDEPIGTISPDLHGHFTEHIGGVVYDGIWVGENSKVANIGGIHKGLADAMQTLRTSVMRLPGGCFADSYDCLIGIGPRVQRTKSTNSCITNAGIADA